MLCLPLYYVFKIVLTVLITEIFLMFQSIKKYFTSSGVADDRNENRGSNQNERISEIEDIVDLSGQVQSKEGLESILHHHSNPKIITRLTISGTSLSELPTVIGKFSSIVEFNLSNNSISILPWSIFYLQQLEELNLSNNLISELPKTIGYLKKLKMLDLRDNLLRYLPSELVYLESLKKIDIMDNKELISPPADDLPLDVEDLKSYLSRRLDRADAFMSCKYYYTKKENVPTLLDMTIRCIMDYKLEYLSYSWVPPTLKHQIHQEANERDKKLHVMKCTKCQNYFSSLKTFELHHC